VIEMCIEALAGKGGKEAKSIIQDLHHSTGLSIGYLYKISDPVRLNGRAIRKDAGERRVTISDDAWDFMTGLTAKYDLDAEQAIELAVVNGKIEEGALHPATYRAWLRERGISRERFNTDVRYYTPWESTEPNAVHHFDTTKLEELHLEDGRSGEESSRGRGPMVTWDPRANRKNARGVKPDPIWLYSMVDDHSRAKFAFLYRSENQFNHLDFLHRAWSEKQNPSEFPFYGVPSHIDMDKGGINYSLKVINALSKLPVHVVRSTPSTTEPFGSRKHGKVENPFKTYAKWMKGLRPRLDVGGLTWDELQHSLYCFLLKINSRVHSTTGQVPFQRWLTIGKPKHTPSEELWRLLKYENDTRRVNKDLTFTINGHLYRLPERRPFIDWVSTTTESSKIEVYWLKDRYEKVIVVKGTVEETIDEARGSIVRPAFVYSERVEGAVDKRRASADASDYGGIALPGIDAAAPKQTYLPRKGEKFDDRRIAEKNVETEAGTRRPSFAPERWLTYVEAARELQNEDFLSRPMKPAEQAWLKGIFAGREKIAETELRQGVAAAQSEVDKAAGGGA